jgi:hypothetical protein
MSSELIEREIGRFLDSDLPESLCIRGKWGVGKTYSWKLFLAKAAAANKIRLSRYSYVSLFGINSLDELKYAIFENTVPRENIAASANFETFKDLIDSLEGWGRKGVWLAKLIPGAQSIFGAATPGIFLSVRNQIICVDDLERKGSKLEISDVLGLISFLKEQRNCKVVLLLNDEALPKEGREDFLKYFEKVIDESVEYLPSPKECAQIAINGTSKFDEQLRNNCESLGIRNIRIIKKIERIARLLMPLLKEFEPELIEAANKSVSLLGWITYAKDDAPSKEFIIHKLRSAYFGSGEKELNDSEKKWNLLLRNYGFSHADEFDVAILQGIERGFFDDDQIKAEALKVNATIAAGKAGQTLEKAWAPYHASIDNNTEEVINSVYQGSIENVKYLNPGNLDSAIRLLRDLDAEEKADKLLDLFLAERRNDRDVFDLERYPFSGDIKDKKLNDEFKKRATSQAVTKAPLDALKQIASGGWSATDTNALAALSTDDFYSFFKSLRGDDLYTAVMSVVNFGSISNLSPRDQATWKSAEAALKKIAGESPLNRRRMRRYGIEPA